GLDEREADSPQAAPTLFPDVPSDLPTGSVTNGSPPHAKIELFRSLFAGRDDVYATRWRNGHTGKAGWSPVVKGGWANARKPSREYLPYTDDVAARHLAGECHAGLYPLVRGDVCRLLVCDFDGPSWVLDALAYLDAARAAGLAPAMERSQSGDGGHVWLFFRGKVAAAAARRIGVHLLRQAMTVRAELDLASYDRLFPAQDFVPKGSFGNLIALPVQGECRRRGNSVFLDPSNLEPWKDQWEFLSSVARLDTEAVEAAETG